MSSDNFGVVVKLSSEKTVKVKCTKTYIHKTYGKVMKSSSYRLCHCELNDINVGDEVLICEGKKISKKKSWFIVEKRKVSVK